MYRRIAGYMKENHMTEAGYTVLAGVSGGSDSMLMLTILRELQKPLDFKLAAVHVHHGIRGQEADRDRAFVEQICEEWGIPCHVFHYDVPALSRKWKLGEEETGRLVRREAFDKAAHSYTDQKVRIALAHNQEDLAETMLHNLCRGTGLRGLCTMRPTAEKIIRPILCLNRGEIADFLEKYQIPHIQDSTNLCDEYTRNRIRHHILPALEQGINPKATAHMAETAFRLSQAEDYLTAQGTELAEKVLFYRRIFWDSGNSSDLCTPAGNGETGRKEKGYYLCSLSEALQSVEYADRKKNKSSLWNGGRKKIYRSRLARNIFGRYL